jgi:hypothetical protein
MTVVHAIQRLHTELEALFEAAGELQARIQDVPAGPEPHLVRVLSDAADTVQGDAAEALAAIARARAADADAALVRRGLAAAQDRAVVIADTMDDLTSYERVDELLSAGREGGTDWGEWALGVRDALERAHSRTHEVVGRLLSGWQEIAEVGVAGGVSVHAMSIGQHFTTGGESSE